MPGWLAADVAFVVFPIATLILGLIIGYLAQRSGFCSIGGLRDLFMFKHTRLFFGYIALIVSAGLSYYIFSLIIPQAFPTFPKFMTAPDPLTPVPGAPAGLQNWMYIVLAIIGGFGMGILGVILGGCPLRQTVMASEGNLKSVFFFLGFAVGAILFHMYISAWVVGIFT